MNKINEIKKWLCKLEKDHNIDILYACEAGSRAWRTETENSDYDVRFVYKYRDLRLYLSLQQADEVIDSTQPLDAQGWDIFKSFQLLQKSNPSLFEWAYSPIVYKNKDGFLEQLRYFIENNFSQYSLCMHYMSLLYSNIKELSGKSNNLKRQKQLIQAYRALIISKNIISERDFSSIPILNLITLGKEKDFSEYLFLDLINAKKQNTTISDEKFMAIIKLLKEERETILKHINKDIKRDSSLDLNKWIWELLKI